MERTFQMVAMATAADRKRERGRERERERETTALRSVDVVLQFFLSKCFQSAFINAINCFIGAHFIFNPAP